MFRVGIVKTQDVANCRVRVTFPDRNQMTSWWLPIVVPKAQNDNAYWMPDLGEQVVCLMDEHDEDGAVLGSIYSSADQPPLSMTADKWHVTMKDTASFEYDRSTHTLAVSIPANGTLNVVVYGGSVNIQAPDADVNFITSEHNTSINKILDWADAHIHNFTDSHGDTGPTAAPTTRVPT